MGPYARSLVVKISATIWERDGKQRTCVLADLVFVETKMDLQAEQAT